MLTIYHCNTSYASQKLRIYLAEKEIAWHSIPIDLCKQENITSDYRQINPMGQVPSMQDESGKIHLGSTAIMEWIEANYPKPALLPKDQKQRQLIHHCCIEQEQLHDPSIRLLSYLKLFFSPEKRAHLDVERILRLAKQHPCRQRGEFLQRILQKKFSQAEIDAAHTAVHSALDQWQAQLTHEGNLYIFGRQYSMADSVTTASCFRLNELGFAKAICQRHHLQNWWQRMQQRPSFQQAILDWLPDKTTPN